MAKVVATEEPETAAKIMQVSTQVAESPPCTPPTNDLANSTSRCEMPPASIRLPARMKKGMAASGNLLMELKISFTATSIFASATTMPTTLASPMDTAMETEIAKQAIMVISMAVVIIVLFPRSEEHTSELKLMRNPYGVYCLQHTK